MEYDYPMRSFMSRALHRLAREPLTYFVLLGGLIFLSFSDHRQDRSHESTIVITPELVELLKAQYFANAKSAPTDAELDLAVDSFIEEEALFRYARSLGLEKNDAVVRRRLVQKARIAIEDAEPLPEPEEDQLRDFYDVQREDYREPARVSFQHVFMSRDESPASDQDCEPILRQLEEGVDPDTIGQPFALGRRKNSQTQDDIQRIFGEAMADALFRIDIATWAGPFDSRYGCHVTRVTEREAEYVPPYEKLHERVVADWRRAERARQNDAAYTRLREQYQISRTDRDDGS